MRVIGLAGWSGAGKTTLLEKLIPELGRRGLSVSTVKHAHHAFDLDQPGKDSFRHRTAGAREVLVASRRRFALIHETRPETEPRLADLLARLTPVDLVIVEGFKNEAHAKIEIHRAQNGKPFLHLDDPGIVAMATDDTAGARSIPSVALDDVAAVADLVVRHAIPIAAAMALLAG